MIIEVGALQAVDAAMTIEGIAFDTFSLSEVTARQAGSTVLAVFYDLGGSRGLEGHVALSITRAVGKK